MPKASQAGYSDNTPLKQEHFRTIMHTLCPIVRSIFVRHTYAVPWFLYIDLTAGPGWMPQYRDLFQQHGILGSPLLALQAARHAKIPLRGFLVDEDPEAMTALTQYLPEYGGLRRRDQALPAIFQDPSGVYQMTLCPGDWSAYTPHFVTLAHQHAGKLYGVIYVDPNGGTLPIADLRALSLALPFTDLIMHCSPTHRKRTNGRYHTHPPLIEVLPEIKKDFWVVRRPYRQEQWTFLIGTNWDAFPKFDRQGFVRTTSPLGQQIITYLVKPRRSGR